MKEKILKIKNSINIKDYLENKGYTLIPNGYNRYKMCCLFHQEKTPSMVVYEDTQDFYCFGCKKHGDIITLEEELNTLTLQEAVSSLGNSIGLIDETLEDTEEEKKILRLFSLLELTKKFFQEEFKKLPEDSEVKKNITDRKLIIDNDFYGFAPKNSKKLIKFLEKKGYTLQEMEDVGLLSKNNTSFFFNRLIFFFHNFMGKTVGFSARKIFEENKELGKYINSKNNVIYNKSQVFYNIDKAKTEIKKEKKVYIVEGQFDAIAMYQNGFKNTIAISGTSFTKEHFDRLLRITDNGSLVFILDGDNAGKKSIYNIFKKFPEIQNFSKVIILPKDKDPCEFLKDNKILPKEENMLDYFFSLFLKQKEETDDIIGLSKKVYEKFINFIYNDNIRFQYEYKVKLWAGVENNKKVFLKEKKEEKNPYLEIAALFYRNKKLLMDKMESAIFPTKMKNFIKELKEKNIKEDFENIKAFERVLNYPLPEFDSDLEVISHFDYLVKFVKRKV